MGTTKFKYLPEKIGLDATKSYFPFYDNEKDADFRVRLDVLVDLIGSQVGNVSKSVFELSGITNSGNNYSSSYALATYVTEGIYIFQPNVDSTGDSTLNIPSTGLGSLPIKKFDGTSLVNVADLKAVNTYLLVNKTTYWLLAGGLAGGVTTSSLQDAYDTGRYVNVVAGEPIELSGDDNLKGRNSGLGYDWELKGNGDFSTKGVINEYSSSTSLLAGYATNINGTNVVYVTGSGITVNGFQGCITSLTSPASHTGSKRTVIFDGVNTLVNGSGFYLLTGANITTASGDKAVFISTFANGWEMVDYVRYDGTALAGSGVSLTQASQAQVEAAFDNTNQTTPVVLEQTSALTPFNAWWLVQKIKAFFDALYLKLTGGTLTGALNYAPSVIPATSATPAIGAAASNNITITSTTTITGFDTIAEGAIRRVKFAAITPLVHSANLDLPTSANITTAVGDEAVFRSNGGGSWKCISFLRKDGSALLTTDQFTAMMEIAVSVNTGSVITSLISATYKYIRLTGCTGLGTILAPSTTSYKDLYIWNDTGNTITLYHNYATDANSILCGANRSWANNTMLHLKYDAIELRWCTVAQDGNTFRALLAGSGTRIVQADSTGQEQAVITTLDIDFTSPQQTSATGASWAGVNEVNIVGLLQGQLYIDVSGGYRYECHRNDYCSRTPIINVETFTTNSLYPIFEITGTSGTFVEDSAYVINNASLVTMSLPSTGTQGKVIIVNGKGAGGWKITVPNTQQIVGGLTNSTTAGSGYIEATGATKQFASVTLKCITSGTAAVWEIVCINPATTLTIA